MNNGLQEYNRIVFDIETVINVDLVRSTILPETPNTDQAVQYIKNKMLEKSNGTSDFINVPFNIPAVISILYVDGYKPVKLKSITPQYPKDLLTDRSQQFNMTSEFWDIIGRLSDKTYSVITFNGRSFDFPTMEMMALADGITIPRNYLNKYGMRDRFSGKHCDLMEVLSNYGSTRLLGGMDALCKLTGIPGKGSVSGSKVNDMWSSGQYHDVELYCEDDVVNTYKLFLAWLVVAGEISNAESSRYSDEVDILQRTNDARNTIQQNSSPTERPPFVLPHQ